MGFEIGRFIFTFGVRTNSVAVGIQLTKYSLDIDLFFVWLGIEKRSW